MKLEAVDVNSNKMIYMIVNANKELFMLMAIDGEVEA